MQFYTAEEFKPILKQIDLTGWAEMAEWTAQAAAVTTNADPDDQGGPESLDEPLAGL
jgi:hypothetical protein